MRASYKDKKQMPERLEKTLIEALAQKENKPNERILMMTLPWTYWSVNSFNPIKGFDRILEQKGN